VSTQITLNMSRTISKTRCCKCLIRQQAQSSIVRLCLQWARFALTWILNCLQYM